MLPFLRASSWAIGYWFGGWQNLGPCHAANALGLTIAPSLLNNADEMIE
jgi:hypothetical protein